MNLERRLEILERACGVKEKIILWVDRTADGLLHNGKAYPDADAMLADLGLDPAEVLIVGWNTSAA